MTRSPWQRALGPRMSQLDPGLVAYFSAIPPGHVGRGSGVFDVVGTPRRWLWPVLALLPGVVFPVWEHAVPFTVANRPGPHGTVRAERVFRFARGDRTMADETGMTSAGLTDRLGFVDVRLEPSVVGGRLILESTSAVLRMGPLRVPLGVLAPRVSLVERSDGARQHVSLRLSHPLLGTLYEYSGSFTYSVEAE
ncbi:MAG: hypothetical protein BGO97_14500 [Micrococcales bacterium 70-64]|nr:DUF4166 domain-containing protein [Leifsonia sp.]ODU65121.1 MAG: hypothetical protein ABT06_14500 [Leifsonia sp. SCN 70-46]OJX86813.1 MAG: hypothetical protein BGO97_14500 [Micrococcales bacterium 70-64]